MSGPACRIAIASLLAMGCGRFDFDVVPRDAPTDGGNCDIATPFQATVMVDGLDTGTGDITLRLQADELTGVFWSLRTGDADIFIAQRPDLASPFTASVLTPVNSVADVDADPAVPADGSFIVFASNRPGGAGGFDLYEAERVAGAYSTPMAITVLDTAINETTPSYSDAESAIYFDSKATGASRIYRSIRSGPATYSAAVQVTELASASGEEFDAAPSSDGLAIFFRSSRPGGPGGGDVYLSTRTSLAMPFGTPVLVDSVSSPTIDGPSFLSRDQCRLYLTSDRTGIATLYVASR